VSENQHLRVAPQWENGVALFEVVIEHELEGVVAKRLDSPYVADRSNDWLKVRAPTASLRIGDRRGR
jgi:ATP-dependent DNA ligase